MFGAIMPAPLTMPERRTVRWPTGISRSTTLGRVSVVRMARAARSPPSTERSRAARAIPSRTLSMGRGTPMTPVEATTTSSAAQPKASAVRAAISRASARPASPVAAFAQPAFTTTARARPERRCSRDTSTGAAQARFWVNTAAAEQVRSATISARSSRSGLIPAATAAARKPAGEVITTGGASPLPLRS